MALTGPLSMGVATASALLQVLLAMCLSACLSVGLYVCLSLCVCLYVDRSACSSCSSCLVLLLLAPCNVVCVGGLQPGYHAHGGRGAGSASPPPPERGSAGALREEGRGDQGVGAWADYDIRLTRLHARPWVGSSLLWVALHRCR